MTIRSWPSRRLQVAVILLLLLGSAAQIFILPANREKRAEQLYRDACFFPWYSSLGIPFPTYENFRIRKLERALELSPGNSLYEQAMVYKCPVQKLPWLLRTHRLGRKARTLADALIYQRLVNDYHGEICLNDYKPSSDVCRLLPLVDALCREDPGNALPHYWRAYLYMEQGLVKESILEIEKGNRIGCVRCYGPELSPEVMAASVDSSGVHFTSVDFGGLALLSGALADAGDSTLRRGDVRGACRILEAGCQMGICVAKSDVKDLNLLMAGLSIFNKCRRQLVPIYGDFGLFDKQKEFDPARHIVAGIRHDTEIYMMRNYTLEKYSGKIARFVVVQWSLCFMMLVSLAFLLVSLLPWGALALARRIKHGEAFEAGAWGEGWLARLYFVSVLPLPALAAVAALFLPSVFRIPAVGKVLSLPHIFDLFYEQAHLVPLILILVGLQAVVAAPVLRKLHRAYDEAEWQATSFARFLFRSPLPVKAWVGRQISAAFAGEALFILCLAMLVVIVYKPLVGCQPWQPNRLPSNYMAQQTQFVKEQTSGLKLNLGFGPEGRQSN